MKLNAKMHLLKLVNFNKIKKKILKISYKSENQPVTNADLEINTFLKNFLKKISPNYGWLSEESIDDKSRLKFENFWCLDPIDGTKVIYL